MPLQIFSLLSSRISRNQASLAPVLYCFLQLTLITALVFACPYFISFQNHLQIVLFWAIALTTITLYFITRSKDPGYIPHDAVFFTDQDELSQRQTPGAWKKFESIGSLKGPFSLPSTCDLPSSVIKSDRIGQKLTLLDAQKFSLLERRAALISVGQLESQAAQQQEKEAAEDTQEVKPADNTAHSFKIVLKELENISEDNDSKDIDTVVECEASLEEVDDVSQHRIETLKIDTKMRSEDCSTFVEKKNDKKVKEKTFGKQKSLTELNKLEKMSSEAYYTVPTVYGEENNKTKCDEIVEKDTNEKDTNEEDGKGGLNILDRISSGNLSPQTRIFTGNYRFNTDEENLKSSKKNTVVSPRIGTPIHLMAGTETQRDELLRPFSIQSRNRLMSNEDTPNKDMQSRVFSFEDISSRKDTKREQLGLLDCSSGVKLPITKFSGDLEADNAKEAEQGEILYAERRYCNICCLDQPFRAKHCRDCGKCVAQYDHHCPWLGTCVGEKNHLVFYWFLLFQVAEIAWPTIKLYGQIFSGGREGWFSLSLVLVVPLTIILIMVTALWIFHSYLATTNLTTWESLSWEKISYLKEWKSEWGSPFSKGVIQNLRFFCCESKSQLQKWRLPKYKKKIAA